MNDGRRRTAMIPVSRLELVFPQSIVILPLVWLARQNGE